MKKQLFLVSIAVFLVSAYAVFSYGSTAAVAHTDVSYTKDIRPILMGRCGSCHTGEFVSEGLNMESYQSLMAGSDNGAVILPGNAGGSLLVKKLLAGEMPKRGPKLTPVQVQLISDWINAGALDN